MDLWFSDNISHWLSTFPSSEYTVGSSETLSFPFDMCVECDFPTMDEAVAGTLVCPAFLPWPGFPPFSHSSELFVSRDEGGRSGLLLCLSPSWFFGNLLLSL